jgi:Tfp pilus assembly protein PilX
MKTLNSMQRQHGVAMVVGLLFLLVVTIISLVAASNSTLGLKMSANMQDSYESFQAAEAGIIAAVATVNTSDDVFDGDSAMNIWDPSSPDKSDSTLMSKINSGTVRVDTDVYITAAETTCPRSTEGSSVGVFDCDYYRVESEDEVPRKARTKVNLGVVKTIIGAGSR